MYITDTNFSIAFSPVDGIKREFVLNIDLSDTFSEPTFLPIPDNAPEDIPRIICQTKGGHSQMAVTKSTLTFNTKYDGEFCYNWDKCRKYLSSKIDYLYTVVKTLIKDESNLKFVGLITQIIFDEKEENATEELIKKFSKIKSDQPIYDYSQKIALIKDKYFFVNLSISNTRLFNGQNSMEPGFLNNEIANKIGIIIDVNDRYAFNYNSNYHSGKEQIDKLLTLNNNIVKNIDNLLDTAEVRL